MKIRAVLVDLDGVLVTTPGLHEDALNYALKEVCGFKIDHAEHMRDLNGLPTKTKLSMLAKQGRINSKDFEIIFAIKQSKTFDLIIETIHQDHAIISMGAYWAQNGFRRVCVTNAIYPTALLMLDQVGVLPYIQKIITPEQMQAPKPHPDGYLQAMEYAQVSPEECIIIEDAPSGLEAARRSGCPNIWRVNSPADVTVDNFQHYIETLKP
jgi:beta-phosphoglucomutase-like phosphatase (HAD superfamily)